MAARAGIEPAHALLQAVVSLVACESGDSRCAQIGAQEFGELRDIVERWRNLSAPLRAAVLGIIRAAEGVTP